MEIGNVQCARQHEPTLSARGPIIFVPNFALSSRLQGRQGRAGWDRTCRAGWGGEGRAHQAETGQAG